VKKEPATNPSVLQEILNTNLIVDEDRQAYTRLCGWLPVWWQRLELVLPNAQEILECAHCQY
jgi:hypothetical protein